MQQRKIVRHHGECRSAAAQPSGSSSLAREARTMYACPAMKQDRRHKTLAAARLLRSHANMRAQQHQACASDLCRLSAGPACRWDQRHNSPVQRAGEGARDLVLCVPRCHSQWASCSRGPPCTTQPSPSHGSRRTSLADTASPQRNPLLLLLVLLHTRLKRTHHAS